MLERPPRMLMSRQMILFFRLFRRSAMRVSGDVVQFRGSLVIFVMGRHKILKCSDLPGLGVGFLRKLIGAV